jgi:hypothetical protein
MKSRKLLVTGFLTAGMLVASVLTACGSDEPAPSVDPDAVEIGEVAMYTDLTRDHAEEDVDYPQTPPVGGNHDPAWLDCNGVVYDEPVRDENAVHSLEHGAVWITYQPDVDEKDLAELRAKVDGQPYLFMSPYPDQAAPIMATAWGVQLAVQTADDPALSDFVEKYSQGLQTPEPGATCDGGVML